MGATEKRSSSASLSARSSRVRSEIKLVKELGIEGLFGFDSNEPIAFAETPPDRSDGSTSRVFRAPRRGFPDRRSGVSRAIAPRRAVPAARHGVRIKLFPSSFPRGDAGAGAAHRARALRPPDPPQRADHRPHDNVLHLRLRRLGRARVRRALRARQRRSPRRVRRADARGARQRRRRRRPQRCVATRPRPTRAIERLDRDARRVRRPREASREAGVRPRHASPSPRSSDRRADDFIFRGARARTTLARSDPASPLG